jgi:hypothetical protein
MNELLALAVEAHGGIDRWNRFKTIDAKLSLGGALWSFKQQPDLFKDVVFSAELHGERVSYQPVTGPNLRTVFVPRRLCLESTDGDLQTAWDNPRSHFDGQSYELGAASRRVFRKLCCLDLSHIAFSLYVPWLYY